MSNYDVPGLDLPDGYHVVAIDRRCSRYEFYWRQLPLADGTDGAASERHYPTASLAAAAAWEYHLNYDVISRND